MDINNYPVPRGTLQAFGLQSQEIYHICSRAKPIDGYDKGSYIDWESLAKYDPQLALHCLPKELSDSVLGDRKVSDFYQDFVGKVAEGNPHLKHDALHEVAGRLVAAAVRGVQLNNTSKETADEAAQ